MTFEQLTYTPQATSAKEHPTTMVLMVDPDMLGKYRAGDTSIPLASIVDSFDVFKFENGKQGRMVHPSKSELKSAFDTTNETAIVDHMLHHGSFHFTMHKKAEPAHVVHAPQPALNMARRAY